MDDELNLVDPIDPVDPQPTPEEINEMFKAMDDSVWVIDSKIENGPSEFQTQEQANAEVGRNVSHLTLMLSKPYIQDAGRELATYEVAIADGNQYIADHPVVENEGNGNNGIGNGVS
jgi:hypothetical protein